MEYALLSAVLLLLANPHPQTATFLTTMQIECHAVSENVCPRYILASPPPPEKPEGRICPTKNRSSGISLAGPQSANLILKQE